MFKKLNFKKFNIFKFFTYFILLAMLLIVFNYYINVSYSNIMNNFYTEFSSGNFKTAKEILSDNKIINVLKKNSQSSDLNKYFTSVIDTLCKDLKINSITKYQALVYLNEINSYNILNSSLDKLILVLDENYCPSTSHGYNSILELANEAFDNNNFSYAIKLLKKIPTSEEYYHAKAENMLEKCRNKYRNNLIAEAEKLSDNEYFSKAIDLLSNYDTSILPADDEKINIKISEIDDKRTDYLAAITYSDDEAATNLISTTINSTNINTLNISSNTPYLIHVDINNQTVSIYNGYTNNWSLVNKYICSTGIAGEDTPMGIFTVTNRGEWFYSKDYGQGGKYWVQFLGDYLFHSLPYDESQNQVLDYTLGTPSSHGCIRLNTEDAKWIYDTIDDDTKVIIN